MEERVERARVLVEESFLADEETRLLAEESEWRVKDFLLTINIIIIACLGCKLKVVIGLLGLRFLC